MRLGNGWNFGDIGGHLEYRGLRLAHLYHGAGMAQLGSLVSSLVRLLRHCSHRLLERISLAMSGNGIKVRQA
jgi:hypothetical protein